jgi:hypothetical protein
MSDVDLNRLEQYAADLFGRYEITDSQFNIGGLEGSPLRGLDIIDPSSGDRYYITSGSDHTAEAELSKKFGRTAVFGDASLSEADLYEIPLGARLLVKTLRQAPYSEHYMQRMAFNAGQFMRRLNQFDASMFGIKIENIAILTDDDITSEVGDDVVLVVVPPMVKSNPPVGIEQVYESGKRFMQTANTKLAYRHGLQGGFFRAAG